jgi:two-component system nitrate/nitrite response regulator NarL
VLIFGSNGAGQSTDPGESADCAPPPVEVVLADGNPLQRLGLRAVFGNDPRIRVVAEAGTGPEAVALAAHHAPGVLVMHLHPGGAAGLAALALIGRSTPVLALSALAERGLVSGAVLAGARSYLVHGFFGQQELIDAVLGTAAGGSFLSPPAAAVLVDRVHGAPALDSGQAGELTRREREVLALMAEGLSNGQIAKRLTISGKTVKNHVHHVYKRLNAASREEAVALWPVLRVMAGELP